MIVIQAGHVNCQENCDAGLRGGTGAPGEIDWTPKIAGAVSALLNGRKLAATVADANWNCMLQATQKQDAFVAIHYQANMPAASGFFVGAQDPNEDQVSAYSVYLVQKLAYRYGKATGLVWRPEWNNANIWHYYAFRANNAGTPGALIECGVGGPGAPDHDFLWSDDGMHKVANAIADGITDYMLTYIQVPKPQPQGVTEADVQALEVVIDHIGHTVKGG